MHHKALRDAGLLGNRKQLPKLGKILDSRDIEMAQSAAKAAKRLKDRRNVYISEKFSGDWKQPLDKLAKKTAEKHGLGWLRFRMDHKRHTNLKEMLLADCANKVMKNLTSLPKGFEKPPPKNMQLHYNYQGKRHMFI